MYYILTILMLNEKLFIHQPIVSMASRPTFFYYSILLIVKPCLKYCHNSSCVGLQYGSPLLSQLWVRTSTRFSTRFGVQRQSDVMTSCVCWGRSPEIRMVGGVLTNVIKKLKMLLFYETFPHCCVVKC